MLTPDELLTRLVGEFEPQMLAAHRAAVTSLRGATDDSTVTALRKARVPQTAELMAAVLGIS